MQKKLTIMVEETVYKGLYKTVGRRRISQFIEDLVRPHVIRQDIENAYKEMAQDELREAEALDWSEGIIGDIGSVAR